MNWLRYVMFFYCIYTALLLDSMASESISESSFLGPRHCYVRYDLLHAIKDDITCENVVKLNPICGRDIKVLFSESAPYIHTDTAGEVHGVLSSKLYFCRFLSFLRLMVKSKIGSQILG